MKGIIMGTRRTDPWAKELTALTKSDKERGWSDFVRVMPILEWNYKEIWNFFLENDLAYCSLYDQGYTYIGEKFDTIKNPYLLKADESNSGSPQIHKPAYECSENFELFSRGTSTPNIKNGKFLVDSNQIHLIVAMDQNVPPASSFYNENLTAIKEIYEKAKVEFHALEKNVQIGDGQLNENLIEFINNEKIINDNEAMKFCRQRLYEKRIGMNDPNKIITILYINLSKGCSILLV